MKTIVLNAPGDVNNLRLTDLPIPDIDTKQVLIRVKAISINPVDVKTRAGKGIFPRIKDQNPIILGWDISGIVEAAGSEVKNFKPGDEVFGMINFPGHGKAYAEYVVASPDDLAIKPKNISFQEAAAATLAALTAFQALVTNAKLQAGNKVLISAAAGGVGHFSIQLAKHLGAYVIGTASAPNHELILSLGADEAIVYTGTELEDKVKDLDFALDTIGGENAIRSLSLIKPGGTLISIPSGLDENVLEEARKRNITAYSFLVASNGDDMKAIADLLHNGTIKAHVSQVFSFDKMKEAHLQIESGRTVGKVVVEI